MKIIDTTKQELKDNYKLLIGSIVPRPIAVVSTRNKDGSNNIAPFSFFNGVCAKPMIVSFCPILRTSTGEKKDTLINIEREREFVVNFATKSWMDAINKTSTELPYGEDEFEYAGLTPINSVVVKAKRLQESPVHFECQLRDILQYGDGSPGTGFLVTGEVVMAHCDESVYDNGRILTDVFRPVGRGGGTDWILTDHRVQLERRMKAPIHK